MPLRAIAVLILAIAFAVSPAFSTFNGFNPDLYPNPQIDPPVQPAGYAFSIWGVIYLWLIASAVFGIWKRPDDNGWNAARLGLGISLLCGVPWLAVAGVSAIGATVLIWAMLITALWALSAAPMQDRWWMAEPTALYAGWLTAASCVSIGLIGAGWGIGDFSQTTWAYISIAVALIIALVILGRYPTWSYGIAVAWALIGIVVKNGMTGVGITAAIGAAIIAATTVQKMRA